MVLRRNDVLNECREMMRRFRVFERHTPANKHHHTTDHSHESPTLTHSKTVPHGVNQVTA